MKIKHIVLLGAIVGTGLACGGTEPPTGPTLTSTLDAEPQSAATVSPIGRREVPHAFSDATLHIELDPAKIIPPSAPPRRDEALGRARLQTLLKRRPDLGVKVDALEQAWRRHSDGVATTADEALIARVVAGKRQVAR